MDLINEVGDKIFEWTPSVDVDRRVQIPLGWRYSHINVGQPDGVRAT